MWFWYVLDCWRTTMTVIYNSLVIPFHCGNTCHIRKMVQHYIEPLSINSTTVQSQRYKSTCHGTKGADIYIYICDNICIYCFLGQKHEQPLKQVGKRPLLDPSSEHHAFLRESHRPARSKLVTPSPGSTKVANTSFPSQQIPQKMGTPSQDLL